MTGPAAGQPVEPVHLENLRFSRVLRTRDPLVRSGRHFIHSPASRTGCGTVRSIGHRGEPPVFSSAADSRPLSPAPARCRPSSRPLSPRSSAWQLRHGVARWLPIDPARWSTLLSQTSTVRERSAGASSTRRRCSRPMENHGCIARPPPSSRLPGRMSCRASQPAPPDWVKMDARHLKSWHFLEKVASGFPEKCLPRAWLSALTPLANRQVALPIRPSALTIRPSALTIRHFS